MIAASSIEITRTNKRTSVWQMRNFRPTCLRNLCFPSLGPVKTKIKDDSTKDTNKPTYMKPELEFKVWFKKNITTPLYR